MSDQQPKMRARLGRVIASYHPAPSGPDRRMVAVASVAFASLVTGTGAYLTWFHRLSPVWLLPGLAGLIASVLMCRHRGVARRIDLHQQGLVRIVGRHERVLFWDQIAELYQTQRRERWRRLGHAPGDARWACRIVRQDGRQLWLRDLENLRGLGQRIQAELTRRRLPAAMEAFRAGYVVRFGRKLGVSQDGLHVGVKLVPWYEVTDINIREASYIRIGQAREVVSWSQLPASQVPNLHLLAALLEAIRRGTVPDAPDPLSPGDGDEWFTDHRDPDDVQDLLVAGYDSEEIRDVLDGDCSLDELLARGPRHRPRQPR
jgi:hypothetical protein